MEKSDKRKGNRRSVIEEVDLAKSRRASRPGDNFGFYPEYRGSQWKILNRGMTWSDCCF